MTRTDPTRTPAKGTNHDHGLSAADRAIADLVSKVANHETRILALEHPVVTPPPVVVDPVADIILRPGESIVSAVAAGKRSILLQGGTYNESFGSVERHESVSIASLPGETAIIDGTGCDPHFVYLGSGATWTLGRLQLQGFGPLNSAVVGIGDGRLVTSAGFVLLGKPGMTDRTSHGLYFYGTGSGDIEDAEVSGVPGAAIQTYRGNPQVIVHGGRFGGLYESAIVYSGKVLFDGSAFTEPTAYWDIESAYVTPTLINCTGTGPNGSVRRYP